MKLIIGKIVLELIGEICNLTKSNSHFYEYNSNEFGATFKIQNDSNFFNSKKIFVKASLRKMEFGENRISNPLFVVQIKNMKGENQYYYSFQC